MNATDHLHTAALRFADAHELALRARAIGDEQASELLARERLTWTELKEAALAFAGKAGRGNLVEITTEADPEEIKR